MPRLDHHLRDTDFFAVLESIAQKRVGFIPALLRFQIVRFIKKHGVDLVLVDEVLNINRLRRFEVYALKIFIPEHNIFSFFIFITFDDLFPWDLLAVFFGHSLVIDRAQVAFAQETK